MLAAGRWHPRFALTDAGASTIGKHLGAGRPGVARLAARKLLLCMCAMGVAVALLFLGGSWHGLIGRVFSRDDAVVPLAGRVSVVCGVAYCLLSVTFACFGTLQGQARPIVAAVAMLLGLWGVSVPLAYVQRPYLSVLAVIVPSQAPRAPPHPPHITHHLSLCHAPPSAGVGSWLCLKPD